MLGHRWTVSSSARSRGNRLAVVLRGWSLAARFALIFALAAYLSPTDVATYGLVVAFSSYLVFVLGLDMYSYTTRQIASGTEVNNRRLIKTHFAFLTGVMLVVLPASTLLFWLGFLPWPLVSTFLLVLVSEHLGIELDRLLIAMRLQSYAGLLIAIRQGLLPTIMIPLMVLTPTARSLSLVFAMWIAFNLSGIAVGSYLVLRATRDSAASRIDWGWMRRGVRVVLPFLAATLLLRLLFTADRQIVASVGGLDMAAAYTLAVTLASGLTSFLAIGVHQFAYPNLIRASADEDWEAFDKEMRTLWARSAAASAIGVAGAFAAYTPITHLLGNPVYVEYSAAIPTAMAAIAVYNLSLVPHYGLYALHADRMILLSTLTSTILFLGIAGALLAIGCAAIWSVIGSLATASTVMLGMKWVTFRRARSHL